MSATAFEHVTQEQWNRNAAAVTLTILQKYNKKMPEIIALINGFYVIGNSWLLLFCFFYFYFVFL